MSENVGSIQPNGSTNRRSDNVKQFTPERKIPDCLVNAICELKDAGWSRPQVADFLGFARTTFWRFTQEQGIGGWPLYSAPGLETQIGKIRSLAALGGHGKARARRNRLEMTDEEYDIYALFRRKKFSEEESVAAVMRQRDRSAQ